MVGCIFANGYNQDCERQEGQAQKQGNAHEVLSTLVAIATANADKALQSRRRLAVAAGRRTTRTTSRARRAARRRTARRQRRTTRRTTRSRRWARRRGQRLMTRPLDGRMLNSFRYSSSATRVFVRGELRALSVRPTPQPAVTATTSTS